MDILVCATRCQQISITWPSQLNSVLLPNATKDKEKFVLKNKQKDQTKTNK